MAYGPSPAISASAGFWYRIARLLSTLALTLLTLQALAVDLGDEVEAESATLSGGYSIEADVNASGGNYTRLLATVPEGIMQFSVDAPTAGIYKLHVYAFNAGVSQDVELSVNGSPTTVSIDPSNLASAEPAKRTYFDVTLAQGTNTISFKTAGAEILLDKVLVTSNFNIYYFSATGDDANDGSIGSPWQTLAKATAIADLPGNGGILQPGDKVLFRAGDTFEGNFLLRCSGSEQAPIEISSYGSGEKPIISGSGSIVGGDYFEAIKLVSTSHMLVTDLWIKNDRQDASRFGWGTDKSFGIYCMAKQAGNVTRNLTFRNLKITDVFGAGNTASFDNNNVTGLRFESDSNKVDAEVSFKDVLIEDCYFNNIGKAGVWSVHKGATTAVDSVNRSMNFVIRNNNFDHTGGSGIILSKMYNALVENNKFDHTGHSDVAEPRLVGRGSGMWVFSSHNILAQYNESYSVRGSGDSYGMHIDFGNKNIMFQYNYSEDSEGGFCEVLGDNHNVAYRFNVSVNDGFRTNKGNTIWTSGFVGSGNDPIPSNDVYVYNNTIYLDANYTPDFSIFSENTYIYNNIFVQTGPGMIGESTVIDIQNGGEFIVANNLFNGNISTDFTNLDNSKVTGDPLFTTAGAQNPDGYKLLVTSPAIDAGTSFPEPSFPMAGQGIFKDIQLYPAIDQFGNAVDVRNLAPNIGADNNLNTSIVNVTGVSLSTQSGTLYDGDTEQLTETIAPANATAQNVTWSSDDETIATVDANGLVTATGVGTANITVTSVDGGFTATTAITVSAIAVTGVSVSAQSGTLYIGDTEQLTETLAPANASNDFVSWSSDDEAVATVDVHGLVTAVGVGTANITVTTVDGVFTSSTAITVSPSIDGTLNDEIEGETATLSGNTEAIAHANASGGTYVRLMDTSPEGTLDITLEDIPETGTYKLYVYAFNNGVTQNINLSVNGGAASTVVLQPSNLPADGPANLTLLDVDLVQGINTISLSAISGTEVLLDYFKLTENFTAYYVSAAGDDANDGSIDSPWQTLDKASEAAKATSNGGLLNPGDKLLFRRGDTFEGKLVVLCSGTEEQPIEFGAYGVGELPIISGSGSIPNGDNIEAIKLTNVSHVIFDGLWVKNDRQNMGTITWSTNNSFGFKILANKWGGISKGLTFRNLKITDILAVDMLDFERNFTRDYYSAHGFFIDSQPDDSTTTPVTRVAIEDVLIEDCYFYNIGARGVNVRHLTNVADYPVDSVDRNRNIVIRNNTFQQIGGDAVVLSSVYNGLVENNDFIDLGWGDHLSSTDRYFGRGEGCWVWNTRNVIIQFNKQYRSRGYGDTYANGHVDFYCKNIIFQYNYSEDTEGGFCEILGASNKSTFRYNVSVNDGFRDFNGYSIWLSGYVGGGETPVRSDSNYVYNNTIYLNQATHKPDISIFAKNTWIYNNIFKATNGAQIGADEVMIDIEPGSEFVVANNLFSGDISTTFSDLDATKVIGSDPQFVDENAGTIEGFQLASGSPAIDAGTTFPEPDFPMAGKGIFKHIFMHAPTDYYGNVVDVTNLAPNIGADNNYNTGVVDVTGVSVSSQSGALHPNQTEQLTATIAPANATSKYVTWSSDDETVATVDTDGLVTTVNAGTATITATTLDGGFTASTPITVTILAVTGVSISAQSGALFAGDSEQLSATIAPADATNQNVTWSSDDEAIATVDANGLVSALSVGSANITVTTVDGGFTSSTAITISPSIDGTLNDEIEGETATLSGNTEAIAHANASGGTYVRLMDTSPEGTLDITLEDIPETGTYKLYVYAFNNGVTQNINLSVNGGGASTVVLQPSNLPADGPANVTLLDVDLVQGINTISLSAISGTEVLLDYFKLTENFTAYYVSAAGDDANDGSIDSPWQTLDKASEAAKATSNGGLLNPGDKLLFRRGDTFEGKLVVLCSGTEEQPIEFGAYGVGELPIISGSGSIPNGDNIEAIKLTNVSHVIFDGLWVKNDRQNMGTITWSTNNSFGFKILANKWGGISKGLTFRNLKITDILAVDMLDFERNFTRDYYSAHGFFIDSQPDDSTTTPVTRVAIEDVLIEDCYFYNIGARGVNVRHLTNVADYPVDSVDRNRNIVIRNNTFQQIGGDAVVLSSVYNGLVENNDFIDLGWGDHLSSTDRYFGRGEGCWVWNTRNVIIQFNKQYRSRGYGDTYANGHVDFYCKNIIFQYNYSEDTEGGFCEILGASNKSTFRYNVSVNDGFRSTNGYSIWLSGYVGGGETPVRSDSNYVYNNTIYLNQATHKPDISIFAKNTWIYNNIFKATNGAQIGADEVMIDIEPGSEFVVANNLFSGDISTTFSDLDATKIIGSDPQFVDENAGTIEGFQLASGSPAIDAGTTFPEPDFPMAGKGIFKHIFMHAPTDYYGNVVDVTNLAPNIGADNNYNTGVVDVTGVSVSSQSGTLYPNQTEQLTATIAPANATSKYVTWSSDDETVAIVDTDGLVTTVNAGTATITATTLDGGFTGTTVITVSIDATLSDLKVSGLTIDGFDPATTSYTYKLAYASTQLPNIVGSPSDPLASVGSVVLTGGSWSDVATTSATASLTVTAQDGSTTETYTINFQRIGNGEDITFSMANDDFESYADGQDLDFNSNGGNGNYKVESSLTTITATLDAGQGADGSDKYMLGALYNSNWILDREFTLTEGETYRWSVAVKAFGETNNWWTSRYELAVKNGTDTLKTPANANAYIDQSINSGNGGTWINQSLDFVVGPGQSAVKLQFRKWNAAREASYHFDNFTLERLAHTDATLSDLTLDGTTISGFAPGTLTYTVELPYTSTALPAIVGTANDDKAFVTPLVTAGGDWSDLNVDTVTATVRVTAEDGTSNDYVITFNRAPSPIVTLSDLQLNGLTIDLFTATKTSYSVNLAYASTSLPSIVPTASDVDASVSTVIITGGAWSDVATTSAVADFTVTAEDGTTTADYSVTFNRLGNGVPVNQMIFADDFEGYGNGQDLDFNSNGGVGKYEVDGSVTTLNAVVDAGQGAGGSDQYGASGLYNSNFTISTDFNLIEGETYTWKVSIKAFGEAGNAWTARYELSALHNTTKLQTPLNADAYIDQEITGATDGVWIDQEIQFVVGNGENPVTLQFHKWNGTREGTYYFDNFTLERAVHTDATLSDLTVDGTTVTGFASGTTSYDVTLPYSSTTLPPVVGTATDNRAATGTAVFAGGDWSNVATTTATATVAGIAEDGTTQDYVVTFHRGPDPSIVASVDIDQADQSIVDETTLQLTATVLPGTAVDKSLTWSSDDTGVATVDAAGLVSAHAAGTAVITAESVNGIQSTVTITVTDILVASVAIDQADQSIVDETTLQLTATVLPANAADKSLTWSSDDTGVATVDAAGLVSAHAAGTAVITAESVNGIQSTVTITVTDILVASVAIDQADQSIVDETTLQLTATVLPANAADKSLTWSSDDTGVATVDAAGLVSAHAAGTAVITAESVNGIQSTVTITVTDILVASVAIDQADQSIVDETTLQLTATVLPANAADKSLTWSSDDTGVATVDAAGLVSAHAAGTAVITAESVNGIQSTVTITVTDILVASVAIDQADQSIVDETTLQLTATVLPANAADKSLTWSSDDTGVATVDAAGLVSAHAAGTAVITAESVNGIQSTVTITVTDILVASVAIDQADQSIVDETTLQLTATVLPANAADKSLTWSSDDTGVATVDAAGLVSAHAAGTAVITAESVNGIQSTVTITVTDILVASVAIDQADQSIVDETTLQLTATVLPANAADKSLTWSSDDTGVATVDAAGLVSAHAAGTAVITAESTNGIQNTVTITVTDILVASVAIDQADQSIVDETTLQLTATVLPANAADKSLTWSSDDTGVATVDAAGLVSAHAAGTAVITAESVNGIQSTVTITVTDILVASVAIDQADQSIVDETTLQLTATVLPANAADKSLTWSSDDTGVATVDAAGLVSAHAAGTAVITAESVNGIQSTVTITVTDILVASVAIDQADQSIVDETTLQLTATVLPANAADQSLTWSSDDTGVATVDAAGLVSAHAAGTAVITAESVNGIQSTVTITVTDILVASVAIDQADQSIVDETTLQLTATVLPANAADKSLTWSSDDTGVATVDVSGLVSAHAAGTAVITAESVNGIQSTVTITVTDILVASVAIDQADQSIVDETTLQLTATVLPANAADKSLTWSSDDTGVATVDASGLVSAHAAGTAVITAESVNGIQSTVTITVTDILVASVAIDQADQSIVDETTLQLTATVLPANAADQSLTWSSDDTGVATVDAAGLVSAHAAGTAIITAESANGIQSTVTITVTDILVASVAIDQADQSIVDETTLQLTATVLPANAADQSLTWSSDDTGVATVDAAGLVSAHAAGTAVITAESVNGIQSTVTITVTDILVASVAIDQADQSIVDETTLQLTATVLPANAADQSLTWSSDDTGVATVDAAGLVSAHAAGTAVITAESVNGIQSTVTITVTDILVASVAIDQADQSIVDETTLQLTATVLPANAADQSLTWSSDDTGVATVDAAGLVSAHAAGTAVITAESVNGIQSTVTITVTDILVASVAIDQADQSIVDETTLQLTATVLPANAADQSLTWSSDDTGVATVDAAGLVSAHAAGTAVITAESVNGIQSTVTITVTDILVASVAIDQADQSIVDETTLQLTATVLPANAADQSLTWSSDDTGVATVDAAGLVSAHAAGTAVITAESVNGIQSTVTITVTDILVASVAIDQADQSIVDETTLQLTATVLPANAADKSLTWSSDDTGVATVDAAGLVSAHALGSVVITAESANGVQGTINITVSTSIIEVTSVSIDQADQSIVDETTLQLTATILPANATNTNLTWSSNNTGIATVDASGLVSAHAAGTAVITAESTNGIQSTVTITVTDILVASVAIDQADQSIVDETTLQLTATVLPANAADQSLTWSSDDTGVATVDAAGLVSAHAAGTAVITAESVNGIQSTVTITVTDILVASVAIDQADQSIVDETTLQLTATVLPANAADQSLTWSSDDTGVATVDAAGLVSAHAAGTAVITAESVNGIQSTVTITVTDILVASVAIDQADQSIVDETTLQLTATVLPANAADKSLIWSSDDTGVATVDAAGLVSAHAAGTAVITAESTNGIQSTVTITVTDILVASVAIDQADQSIVDETTLQLTATVLPANAADKSLTWSSDDTGVATVDASGLVSAHAAGTAVITAESVNGIQSTVTITVTDILVASVAIDQADQSIVDETTLQLTATVLPANAADQSLTWSSDDTGVATVDATGLVSAHAAGTAIITAESTNGIQSTVTITVTDILVASVAIDQADQAIVDGTTLQLTATVLPANAADKSLIWSSDDTGVATVDAAGLVSAHAAGTAIITAESVNGIQSTVTITVTDILVASVAIDQADQSIVDETTLQLTATVLPANAADKSLTWSSDDTGVATVDAAGLVSAHAAGTAIITAESVNGIQSIVTITVTDILVASVAMDQADQSIVDETTLQLTATVLPANATDQSLTWSSDDTGVATVDATGLVSAHAAGTATITTESVNGIQSTVTITVTDILVASVAIDQADQSIVDETTLQLTATVLPANAADQSLTWSSDDTGVATVDATGLVSAHAAGTAVITAESVNGIQSTVTITVTDILVASVAIDQADQSIVDETTLQLTATVLPANAADKSLIWSSDDTGVATVDAAGLVSAHAAGTAIITAESVNGIQSTVTITVTDILVASVAIDQADQSIVDETTLQLTATVLPANAADQSLTWSSSNINVATVDAAGLVSAHGAGTAVITAESINGIQSTVTITVTDILVSSVDIDQADQSIADGATLQLTATVLPSNAADQSLTWSSNNTSVATVNATGMVSALATGSATITARSLNGKQSTVKITITDVLVTSVDIDQEDQSIDAEATVQLTATVLPVNAANKSLIWSSSDETVASVDALGMVIAHSAGEATITAASINGPISSVRIAVEEVILGTPEADVLTQEISLYPNPAIDYLAVDVTGMVGEKEVIVSDGSGRTVRRVVAEDASSITIDVSDLTGIYFVTLVHGNSTFQKKIMVK